MSLQYQSLELRILLQFYVVIAREIPHIVFSIDSPV